MKGYVISFLIFALSLLGIESSAQPLIPSGLHFQHFTVRDGLSNSTVNCLCQDQRGLLWAGTINGLNYFDGKTFVPFYSGNEDSVKLHAGLIVRVHESANHNILFLTNDGLCELDWNDKTMRLIISNAERDNLHKILDFYIDRLGNIWILTLSDVLKLAPSFKVVITYKICVPVKPRIDFDNSVNCFIQNNISNNIWFVYKGFTNEIEDSTGILHSACTNTNYPKLYTLYPTYISEGLDGNIWGNAKNKLFCYNKKTDSITYFNDSAFDNKFSMRSILVTRSGDVWIDSWYTGILIFNPKTRKFHQLVQMATNQASPAMNVYNAMLEDKDGNIWLASDEGLDENNHIYNSLNTFGNFGLLKIGNALNKVELSKPVISKNKIFIPTDDGQFVIGRNDLTIHNYRLDTANFSLKDHYWANLKLDDNRILASRWPGLVVFDATALKLNPLPFSTSHPAVLDSVSVVSMFLDKQQNVWLGLWNDNGVMRWDMRKGTFTLYTQKGVGSDFFPLRHFSTAADDGDGHIFMGYDKGGICIFDKKAKIFRPLPLNKLDPLNTDSYHDMQMDHQGNLWIATSNGLIRYSLADNSYIRYTNFSGQGSSVVFTVALDNSNRLWIGETNGISCFNTVSHQFINYNHSDGFPDAAINNLVFDSISNIIYFTATTSFGYFNPDKIQKYTSGLNPIITSFKIHGREKNNKANNIFHVGYDENFFSFNFTAPDFTNPSEVRYACKLEGLDKDWVDLGTQQYVSYANLAGGNYTFMLKASTDKLNWHVLDTPVKLHIDIPFYKTIWFSLSIIIGAFLISLFALYLIQRMRLKRIMEGQKIRENIASDLHDEIGSSLSSIMLMSEIAKIQSQPANDYLSRIGQTSGKVIENMSDIVWAVQPENDGMRQILMRMQEFATDLLYKKNITLDFSYNEDVLRMKLDMSQRKSFYLIFKETIHNAFKYSDCAEVNVKIDGLDGTIKLKIEDNGKGFDTTKKHSGNGMNNLKKRAAEIKAKLNINSVINKGTVVELTFKTTQTGSQIAQFKKRILFLKFRGE